MEVPPMTDINHAELSKQLALALGYFPESVRVAPSTYCAVYRNCYGQERWEELDYRDPTVCLPLIEWLGSEHRIFFWWCGPTDQFGPRWSSSRCDISDTLAEAVARAVIAVKGGG
jgi:hypothetical protein